MSAAISGGIALYGQSAWELGRGGMSIYAEASSQPRGDGGGGSVNPSGARRGVQLYRTAELSVCELCVL